MEVLKILVAGGILTAVLKILYDIVCKIVKARESRSEDECNLNKAMLEKIDDLQTGQRIIMQDRLKWLAKKYISENEIDFDDRDIWIKMHDSFQVDGGNGNFNATRKEIEALPLKKGKEDD